MATIELNGNEWKEFSKHDYAIIDCYGEHCPACVILKPVFDSLADDMSCIAFGKINISKYPEIAEIYNIDAIPTILYFRNGKQVNMSVGSMEREDLLTEISKLLYK